MTDPVPAVRGDLAAFDAAIFTLSGEIQNFETEQGNLKARVADRAETWRSPSSDKLVELEIAVTTRVEKLHDLLEQALIKLRQTRANYESVLTTNAEILQ